MKKDESKLIFVRLSPEKHQKLRVRCAQQNTSIQRYVELLIEQSLLKNLPMKRSRS